MEPILINSALLSAQNRQRLYWTNIPDIEQPEDRGILLRDILETGLPLKEKAYTLKADYAKSGAINGVCGQHFPAPMAADPMRIGTIESDAKNADFDSQQYRVYSPDGKSVTLCGQGGGVGAKTGLYAVPLKEEKVGVLPNGAGELTQCQSKRIYSVNAKARVLNAGPGGLGVQTGLYAVSAGEGMEGKTYPVYEVRGGKITIKGKQYPIKLADGFYIIRKLTVTECKRLQTVPEDYIFPVSDTQAYKMLGNGWTVDVIAHILHYAPGITDEPLEVLSMYRRSARSGPGAESGSVSGEPERRNRRYDLCQRGHHPAPHWRGVPLCRLSGQSPHACELPHQQLWDLYRLESGLWKLLLSSTIPRNSGDDFGAAGVLAAS